MNPLLTTISASGDGRFLTFTIDTRTTRRSDLWSLLLQKPGNSAPLVQEEYNESMAQCREREIGSRMYPTRLAPTRYSRGGFRRI